MQMPLGQSGEYPRVLGGRAGVPILEKMFRKPYCTRSGFKWDWRGCHGKGQFSIEDRAKKSIQTAKARMVVQRSPAWDE
jgi:hypothetical protein